MSMLTPKLKYLPEMNQLPIEKAHQAFKKDVYYKMITRLEEGTALPANNPTGFNIITGFHV